MTLKKPNGYVTHARDSCRMCISLTKKINYWTSWSSTIRKAVPWVHLPAGHVRHPDLTRSLNIIFYRCEMWLMWRIKRSKITVQKDFKMMLKSNWTTKLDNDNEIQKNFRGSVLQEVNNDRLYPLSNSVKKIIDTCVPDKMQRLSEVKWVRSDWHNTTCTNKMTRVVWSQRKTTKSVSPRIVPKRRHSRMWDTNLRACNERLHTMTTDMELELTNKRWDSETIYHCKNHQWTDRSGSS